MCNDDGSRPAGQAIAVLRPPLLVSSENTTNNVTANSDTNVNNLSSKYNIEWTLLFSNPLNEAQNDGKTTYTCQARGNVGLFSEQCQIRIQ